MYISMCSSFFIDSHLNGFNTLARFSSTISVYHLLLFMAVTYWPHNSLALHCYTRFLQFELWSLQARFGQYALIRYAIQIWILYVLGNDLYFSHHLNRLYPVISLSTMLSPVIFFISRNQQPGDIHKYMLMTTKFQLHPHCCKSWQEIFK